MTPQRARWVLAEQPGREVTAVRDAEVGLWTTLLVDWGPLDEAEDPR